MRALPQLRNCPNLKELHLGFNRIEELTDDTVEALPTLKLLDLKENKVTLLKQISFKF
jgi:Leucine-rich repeat (LRR) protein